MNHPRRREAPRPRGLRIPRRAALLAGLVVCAAFFGGVVGPWLGNEARQLVRREPFTLTEVVVSGARRISAAEIAAVAGAVRGTPLLDIDLRAVEARLRSHPWVHSARALRLPPSGLLVGIEERVPRAVVAAGHTGTPHFVDAHGVAFAVAAIDSGLPVIRPAAPVELGLENAALAEAVALATALDRFGFAPPAEIHLSKAADPAGVAIRLRGVGTRVVLGRGAPDAPLLRLAQLVAARPQEVARAEVIDLRFEGRAVLRSDSALGGAG